MARDYQSRANILIDPLGRVRAGKNSAPLSSPGDRDRFHQLRQWADCLVVGGETFRNEPYHLSSLPVASYSRTLKVISDWPGEFRDLAGRYGDKILVEAGPNLLHQLLDAQVIDQIHLTRTSRRSDDATSPIFDLTRIKEWKVLSEEADQENVFEIYSRD